MVFSKHLLLGMLQTVGEDLLSYRANPTKVTQTTQKLGAICCEEEQFPFPAPSFLGSYLLGFLYPRQTRIGCRLFPLRSVAGIGNYQRCFLVSRGRGQCWVSSWLWGPALPCSEGSGGLHGPRRVGPFSRMRLGLKNMYSLSISRTCSLKPLTLHSLHIYFIPKHQIDDQ